MMAFATYLKSKQSNIKSKYHRFIRRFESKYELIHENLTSRFHRETTEIEVIRSKINNLIIQSTESIENQIRSKRSIPVFSETPTKIDNKLFPDIIDWYQGRFSGQTIRIVVREGKIIEKVFLTPKGNEISAKRSHLLLQYSSLLRIQIKFSLRSKLIENIQRYLRSISLMKNKMY
tara:strand:+ start:442 stop:969 length:528 start_codon:yes stop_codon:yes gene_type:complete